MSIEAMKLALEVLENAGEAVYARGGIAAVGSLNTAATALRQAIEQAEQAQPMVWMYQDKSTHEVRFQKHMSAFVDHSRTSEVPLYGEPLANHELQCVCGAVWCGDEMVHLPNKKPPRQPLTRKQIDEMADDGVFLGNIYEIAQAIESAHGIKGEA